MQRASGLRTALMDRLLLLLSLSANVSPFGIFSFLLIATEDDYVKSPKQGFQLPAKECWYEHED